MSLAILTEQQTRRAIRLLRHYRELLASAAPAPADRTSVLAARKRDRECEALVRDLQNQLWDIQRIRGPQTDRKKKHPGNACAALTEAE